jgi:hypothetical protein
MNRVVGTTPNNTMANKTGLDDIDKWAERVGQGLKRIQGCVIQRKGKKQV